MFRGRRRYLRHWFPTRGLNHDQAMALVAVLGTTISPYLVFWQSPLEVEDRLRRGAQPLAVTPKLAKAAFTRIRIDTIV